MYVLKFSIHVGYVFMIRTRNQFPLCLTGMASFPAITDCAGKGTDWSELKKHEFDNVSLYLAMKKERLSQKRPEVTKFVSDNHELLPSGEVSLVTEYAG